MRLFGLDISVRKARTFSNVDDSRGWMTVHDTFPGSWQQDVHVNPDRASAHYAVFACQTRIAGDIGKLGVKLTQWSARKQIYEEVDSPTVSPFLRKPNSYQTWQKFVESWILSKVAHGNAYVLKVRDARNVVVSAHVLNPALVQPLVADDGSVFYRLQADDLAGIDESVPVPASEIIHDRYWCLFHPLVGISPLYAAGLAATHGLEIQQTGARFFRNAAVPSGLLTTPGRIPDADAKMYQDRWETNYGGANRGRTAILGNGLKYERLTDNAVDSDLVEQWKLTGSVVCTAYQVPPYKVQIGPTPTYQNAEILNQIYYDDCLHPLIKSVEDCLDEGLDLPQKDYKANLDENDLLRMDKSAQMEFVARGIERGVFSPNEGRRVFNYAPVTGGESPMIQQQNFSLAALAKRDAKDDPFGTAKPTPAPAPTPEDPAAKFAASIGKGLGDRVRELRRARLRAPAHA